MFPFACTPHMIDIAPACSEELHIFKEWGWNDVFPFLGTGMSMLQRLLL